MATTTSRLNFPEGLSIKPSSDLVDNPTNDPAFGISAQRESIQKYGIAGRVWEAAYVINLYLDPPLNLEFDPPFLSRRPLTIIELGSGTGVVGCTIANKVARHGLDIVIVTDLPEVCPLLKENMKGLLYHEHLAPDAVAHARPLTWGNSEHALRIGHEFGLLSDGGGSSSRRYLTHVICSDLVYFPELLVPLLRSLIQLTSPPFVAPETPADGLVVVMSYKVRSLLKETSFWSAFGLWFSYQPVLARAKASNDFPFLQSWKRFGSSLEGPTFVFVARRRVESFSWEVPRDDGDLLRGVGSWGSATRKSDDTFETLMFMTLGGDDDG